MWTTVRRRSSTFLSAAAVLGLVSMHATPARAQACCAATGVVTPARLGIDDQALVGGQARVGAIVGSYDHRGNYVGAASGTTEVDAEQDAFAAARFLPRAQLSMLVPFVQTYRSTGTGSEAGGGLGDLNAGVRYDFTWVGARRYVPGIAALGGLTIPSGRPPEAASNPLATDATGSGFVQVTAGLALEESFGPWLFDVTGIVAFRPARSARGVEDAPGPQVALLGAVTYTLENGAGIAVVASYTLEGDVSIDGRTAPDTARRVALLTLAGLYPLPRRLRLQGSVFGNPPAQKLGKNSPVGLGAVLGLVRPWS